MWASSTRYYTKVLYHVDQGSGTTNTMWTSSTTVLGTSNMMCTSRGPTPCVAVAAVAVAVTVAAAVVAVAAVAVAGAVVVAVAAAAVAVAVAAAVVAVECCWASCGETAAACLAHRSFLPVLFPPRVHDHNLVHSA